MPPPASHKYTQHSRFSSTPLISLDNEKELRGKPLFMSTQPSIRKMQYENYPGDNCMGCANGWNHYCGAVQEFVDFNANLAILAAPTTSNNVTRISLAERRNENEIPVRDIEENILGSIILEKRVKQVPLGELLALICRQFIFR